MRFISERPYIISLVLIVLVALWMFAPAPQIDTPEEQSAAPEKRLQKVQVRTVESQQTELELVFTGRTEPNQQAEISSELDGLLIAYSAGRGTRVNKGDAVAEISKGSLDAALAGARAERESAAVEYKAQANLVKRGLNAQNGKAQANAALQAAKARVQQLETELSKALVVAPFEGIIADHHAEIGEFMGVGKPLATLIDLDPLRAVGDVAERDIAAVELGKKAFVTLLDGKTVEGEISYVAPFADESTRTFRVEVTLPNKDHALVVGMTTQITLPIRTVDATKISPALLTLSSAGDIQVATVDQDDRVALHVVDLLRSERDGLWVTGVPLKTRLITLGQGFVYDGDLVEAIEEKPSQATVENNN